MISVIIPHRTGETCNVTLKTLAMQTYKGDIEIIQVEDTDAKGASWARNQGFKKAIGNFLFFCDNDIHLFSNALQVLYDTLMANPDCSYAYGAYRMAGRTFCASQFNADILKKTNFISTMSLIRREDFPGFDENIKRLQDWDLWLNMLINHGKKGVFCERILFTTEKKDGITFGKDAMPYEEAVRIVKEKYGLQADVIVANNPQPVGEEEHPDTLKVFFALGDEGGSGFIRVITPAIYLEQRCNNIGIHLTKSIDTDEENQSLNEADIVVLQRQMLPNAIFLINTLKRSGKKVVYELDDDFWHIPNDNAHKHIYNPETLKVIEKIISVSDAVTVSTEPLAEVVRKFNKNVQVLPNSIEFTSWMDDPKLQNEKIRIGWAGGHQHKDDLAVCRDALLEIARKYKDTVQLVFMGMMPDDFIGIAEHYPFVPYQLYMGELQRLNLDIGILPLAENIFTKSKSNIKFVDYSALHIASIASPVYPYATTIKHGETGLIVKKNRFGEWVKALTTLIEDAELRRGIAEDANKYVKEHFDIQHNVKKWESLYRGLKNEKS